MSINLITIRGSSQLLQELATNPVEELDFHEETARRSAPPDTWEVGAYASDDAIAELNARGLVVEVRMNTAELQAHMAQLRAQATGVPLPPIA